MTSDRAADPDARAADPKERGVGVGAGRSSKRSTEPFETLASLAPQEPHARSRPRVETTASPPPDTVANGPDADPESVARTILLDQLTGRARSRRELADKLAQRNVPEELASRLLDRFEEVGLVDDAAFAHSWVEGRHAARGLAPRALAQELRRKGVADEVAREALDQLGSDELAETARSLVRKKLRSLERFDDVTKTRRLVGMLARKGYSPGLAYAVVKAELALED